MLCMITTMDPALLQLVQQHVHTLNTDVDKLAFEMENDRETVKKALQDVQADLEELEKRVSRVEQGVKQLRDEQSAMDGRFQSLKSDQEDMQQRVTKVEEQLGSAIPRVSCGN